VPQVVRRCAKLPSVMGRRRIAAILYVALPGALATAGAIAGDPRYYLAAVIVTLPLGPVALVGGYLGYAVVQGIGGLFFATRTAGGDWTPWLQTATGILFALLFVTAAVGNLLILRHWRRPHRDSPVGRPEEFKPAT
jgi:hypothetical protein